MNDVIQPPPAAQDPVVLTFNDTELRVITHNGQKWVTVKELAQLLGYSTASELNKLIRRNPKAFQGKCFSVKLTENSQGRPETILSYHGVIRVAMHSEAPNAFEFQEWAEKVLYDVMVKGYHIQPGAESAVMQRVGEVVAQVVIEAIAPIFQRLEAVETRQDQVFIPAPQDNSFWPTPAERARVLIDPREIPKGFNSGASFDVFTAQRSADIGKGFLSQRNRRHLNKLPDYVIQPCLENDQFLRETFRVWLRTKNNQLTLKLTPSVLNKRYQTEVFDPGEAL